MGRFVGLLRGINVGGRNVIPMRELNSCVQQAGFSNVSTYIQSGNVLFETRATSITRITKKLETALADRFDYLARVVVLSKNEYLEAVEKAHKTWGQQEGWKHNAMFLTGDLDPATVLSELPKVNSKIERVSIAQRVIFWSANIDKIQSSTMMKLAKSKMYQQLTVRNHKTTFKLVDLLN